MTIAQSVGQYSAPPWLEELLMFIFLLLLPTILISLLVHILTRRSKSYALLHFALAYVFAFGALILGRDFIVKLSSFWFESSGDELPDLGAMIGPLMTAVVVGNLAALIFVLGVFRTTLKQVFFGGLAAFYLFVAVQLIRSGGEPIASFKAFIASLLFIIFAIWWEEWGPRARWLLLGLLIVYLVLAYRDMLALWLIDQQPFGVG